jgi:excisionase family DNA binding protein
MPMIRIKEAAVLLGISTDTLRRWADRGRIEVITDAAGRQAVDGRRWPGWPSTWPKKPALTSAQWWSPIRCGTDSPAWSPVSSGTR